MLHLGREVRLGGALLRLYGPESAEIQASGSPRGNDLPLRQSSTPRCALLRLGVGVSSRMHKWTIFDHFQLKSFNQIYPFRNKTTKLT